MSPELLIVASNSKNNDNITYDSDYSGNVLAEYNARLYGSECVCSAETSAGWTPDELSPLLWLDASDETTISLSSGSVSQWSDKSGNNNHANQSTFANMPIYATGELNGLNVVNFNGQKILTGTTAQYRDLYMVFSLDYYDRFNYIFTHSNVDDTLRYEYGKIRASPDSNDWHYGQTGKVYIDGTQTTNKSSHTYQILRSYRSNTNGFLSSFDYQLNSSWGSYTREFIGKIAEVVVFSAAQSSTNRQLLEGYLAHKWGLSSNLPATHPYKSSAPESTVEFNEDYLPNIAKQYCIK